MPFRSAPAAIDRRRFWRALSVAVLVREAVGWWRTVVGQPSSILQPGRGCWSTIAVKSRPGAGAQWGQGRFDGRHLPPCRGVPLAYWRRHIGPFPAPFGAAAKEASIHPKSECGHLIQCRKIAWRRDIVPLGLGSVAGRGNPVRRSPVRDPKAFPRRARACRSRRPKIGRPPPATKGCGRCGCRCSSARRRPGSPRRFV